MLKIMTGSVLEIDNVVACNRSLDETTKTDLLFEKYLEPKPKAYLIKSISEGIKLREIFSNIKEKYPDSFRKSLKRYLQDYPTGNIYDNIEFHKYQKLPQ